MQIVAGLDTGSSRTRCMILGLEDGKVRCHIGSGEYAFVVRQ